MTTLEDLINTIIQQIREIADLLPVITVIHNLRSRFTVEYMSATGLAVLRTTLEELRETGPDYHARFCNEKDSADYLPRLNELIERNDPHAVFTFFQRVRAAPEAEWQWYLSSMRLLLRDADGQPLLAITQAVHIDPHLHLTGKVTQLLEDNVFFRDNYSLYLALTKREKELLRLLAHAKTNKEIAEELFLSVNTVETHKKNLKTKLKAGSSTELIRFARAFEH